MAIFNRAWPGLVFTGFLFTLSFLVVPAASVLWAKVTTESWTVVCSAVAVVMALSATYLALGTKPIREMNWRIGLLIIALTSLFVHALPLIFLDNTPEKSDFLKYWQHTLAIASGEKPFPVVTIYDVRTLPILLPLAKLFGSDHGVYQAFNLLAHTCALLAIGWHLCRHFGPKQGITAALIIALIPEFYGVMFYAHHDFYGMLLLLLCYFCIVRLDRSHRVSSKVMYGVGLGFLFWVFSLQRMVPYPLILAMLIVLLISTPNFFGKEAGHKVFHYLVIPILVYLVLVQIAVLGGLIDQSKVYSDANTNHWQATYLPEHSTGRFNLHQTGPLVASQTEEETQKLVSYMVGQAMRDDPIGYLQSRYKKAERLLDFGSNVWFYAPKAKSKSFRATYLLANAVACIVLNFLIVCACVFLASRVYRILFGRENLACAPLWPVVVVCCVAATFASLFETTSRHMMVAYGLLPLSFFALGSLPKGKTFAHRVPVLTLIAIFLSIIVLWLVFRFGMYQATTQLISMEQQVAKAENSYEAVNGRAYSIAGVPAELRKYVYKYGYDVHGKYDYFVLPQDKNRVSLVQLKPCTGLVDGWIERLPTETLDDCEITIGADAFDCSAPVTRITGDFCGDLIELPVTNLDGTAWRLGPWYLRETNNN